MASKQSFVLSFLLLLFVYNIDHSIGVNVNDGEISCLNQLASNTGGYTLTSLASTFCSMSGNKCYENGSISEIKLYNPTTDYTMSSGDFSCFLYVTKIDIKGKVSENFFTSFTPYLKFLTIDSSVLPTLSVTIARVYQLVLTGTFTSIKASQLKNIENLSVYNSFDMVMDAIEQDSVLANLGYKTKTIPNVSYFKSLKQISITLDTGFDSSSYSNIQYFTQLDRITFSGSASSIDFPYQLTEITGLKYSYLSMYVKFNPLTKYIDLSNNQLGKSVYIYIENPGSNFNINGEFPIAAFPKDTNHVEFLGVTSKMPNLSIFKNIKYTFMSQGAISSTLPSATPLTYSNSFGINSASLTGTVDETWCNTLLPTFAYNKLSGALPDCFYCHLSGTSLVASSFQGNSFTNYNTSTSNCNYTQINVELDISNQNKLVIYGKNIGYDSNNIITIPSSVFSSIIQFNNGNFTTQLISNVKNVQIKFKSQPNLSFTVSTSKTAPIIDSITQDNTTITIEGSYFNNIPNNIQVSIEGGLGCKVSSSTFYKIICEIDQYPIKPYGSKLLTVKVLELSSSSEFNLIYTPIPCPVSDCNGNGVCNDHEGICECYSSWITYQDKICQLPNIFVSSSTQVHTSVNLNEYTIQLFGWFGLKDDIEFILTIGETTSIPEYYNVGVLTAKIPSGKGKLSIKLQKGPITWVGYIYPYLDSLDTVQCFNNCSGPSNGVCSIDSTSGMAECICKENFYGIDCSSILPSDSPTSTLTTNKGLPISLANEQTGFYINIVSIKEYSLNGTLVDSVTPIWIVDQNPNSNSDSNYVARYKNTTSNVASISFTNHKNQNVTFGDNQFLIQNGIASNFKLLLWQFKNTSNTIQVEISSEIKIDSKATQNKCNSDKVTISTGSMIKSSNNINFLKVSKNAKSFYARIYDKAIINDIPTQVETSLISEMDNKVTIGINFPHTSTGSLYSDFSLFLSPDFNSSTSCKPIDQSSDESEESSDEPSSSSTLVYSFGILVSLILFNLI